MASELDSSAWKASTRGRVMAFKPGSATISRRRERGAFAIMFVPLLLVIIAFCGMAIDAGQMCNRKVDLSGMAKAVALAAARELNGTDAGITAAKTRARETAEALKYQYFEDGVPFTWNEAALSFSTGSARNGEWIPAASATGSPPTTKSATSSTDQRNVSASLSIAAA